MLRGILGRALRSITCVLKSQTCSECILKTRCLYALSFETQEVIPGDLKTGVVPHPFVIEPPLTPKTHFSAGDTLEFKLLLFGEINRSLPYFIYAIKESGKIGIGKRINGKKGKFTLEDVRAKDKSIYSNNTVEVEGVFSNLEIPVQPSSEKGIRKLRLNLLTPLRLKFRNRLNADLPFHILMRASLRRVSSLLTFYGEGEPSLDYRALVRRSEHVNTCESDIHWFDWRRYSFRQSRSMLMGGVMGSITYEGDLGEFIPFIDFCSKVHIGKQTSFGLGKIEVETLT